jgi:type II secretory pathway pseudopilin PulG
MKNSMRGTSAVEMLVALAIIAALSTTSTVALANLMRRQALREISIRIYTALRETQTEAVVAGQGRAVRFMQTDGGWAYGIYEDGNGDGVLNSDIKKGIDRLVRGPVPLCATGGLACLGFPHAGVTDPDGTFPILPSASPLNFNHSALCSFAPDGDSTPGTVYLTDGVEAWAIRSSGTAGRIYLMQYNGVRGRWEAHEPLPS